MSCRGACLCGETQYQTRAPALSSALCHCPSCKRAAGAPMVGWAMFRRDDVEISGALKTFSSSEGVMRGFCGGCGTTLSFEATYMPGLIDMTIASMANTADCPPTMHIFDRHTEGWMKNSDRLPRHQDFPPQES